MDVLLAPLAYDGMDAWCSAVGRALKDLVGADAALVKLPADLVSPAEDLAYSDDVNAAPYVAPYGEALAPLDDWFDVWGRATELGVCDRRTLWGEWLGAYYESPYYHEFVRPVEFFGSALLTLGSGRGPRGPIPSSVRYDDAFQIALGRGDRRAEFDEHGDVRFQFSKAHLRTLALLRPAAQAAVDILRRLGRYRTALVSTLDVTGAAVLLADAHGNELHRTPALCTLLEASDLPRTMATLLIEEARRCARSVATGSASGMRPTSTKRPNSELPGVAHCCGQVGPYQLSSTLISAPGRTAARQRGGYVVAVVVTRRDGLPMVAELQEWWNLTPQQARVALLLAKRRTNSEIADTLCISPHTAHRHTHAVLAKLDVRSRRDVRTCLTSPDSDRT